MESELDNHRDRDQCVLTSSKLDLPIDSLGYRELQINQALRPDKYMHHLVAPVQEASQHVHALTHVLYLTSWDRRIFQGLYPYFVIPNLNDQFYELHRDSPKPMMVARLLLQLRS